MGRRLNKIANTVREALWLLAGIAVLLVGLSFYNLDFFKLMYLRHLKASEDALSAQVRSLPGCANWTAEIAKIPKEPAYAAIDCEAANYRTAINLLTKSIETHKKRLRLDVKWGFADSKDDVIELGWNHPRPEWSGQEWVCPPNTEPREILAEKEAGASEYVHCLP